MITPPAPRPAPHLHCSERAGGRPGWRGLDTVAVTRSRRSTYRTRRRGVRSVPGGASRTATRSTRRAKSSSSRPQPVPKRAAQIRPVDRYGDNGEPSIPVPSPGRRCGGRGTRGRGPRTDPMVVLWRVRVAAPVAGRARGLGYRDRDQPIQPRAICRRADREAAVADVVTRCAARSAERRRRARQVEQPLARRDRAPSRGADRAGRGPTARGQGVCVPRANGDRDTSGPQLRHARREPILSRGWPPAAARPSPGSQGGVEGWTRVSGWPCTAGDAGLPWWMARPARARPRHKPRQGTRWPRSTDDWLWSHRR